MYSLITITLRQFHIKTKLDLLIALYKLKPDILLDDIFECRSVKCFRKTIRSSIDSIISLLFRLPYFSC